MKTQKKHFKLKAPFKTESGFIFKEPVVAYEEYGNSEGEVIFVTHGGLSDMHAAGVCKQTEAVGWWDDIIGKGKVLDTEKYRIICANALGSMFGSTGPVSINPDTNQTYGSGFPDITMIDMANFFKSFLDELGIKKVFMQAGPSMGSMINLQMAALFPDLIGGVVSFATAGRMTASGILMHNFIINCLKFDPDYNNGNYKEDDKLVMMKILHMVARIYYTSEKAIKKLCWDGVMESENAQDVRAENINSYLITGLDTQAEGRDANSYIKLVSAINTFDLRKGTPSYEEGIRRIKCPVILANMDTDIEFPFVYAKEVADILNEINPGQAEAVLIKSDWGHLGCLRETDQIIETLSKMLLRLS
jgi:homoserine O-acetyltransferase